jgi:hypothetical protein
MTFEHWIRCIFEQSAEDCTDNSRFDWGELDALNLDILANYVTALFENATVLTANYSDSQIALGLEFIISNIHSSHYRVFKHGVLIWPIEKRLLSSMRVLFVQLFAQRCSQSLSHGHTDVSQLNRLCYMWFDILPLRGEPDDDRYLQRDELMLDLFNQILLIEHVACRESALHGLGHWQISYEQQVENLIKSWLHKEEHKLSEELVRYALSAREGLVI